MSNTHTNKLRTDFHAETAMSRKEFCLETAALEELMTVELNEDFFLFEFGL
jgi:hypothetical protein